MYIAANLSSTIRPASRRPACSQVLYRTKSARARLVCQFRYQVRNWRNTAVLRWKAIVVAHARLEQM